MNNKSWIISYLFIGTIVLISSCKPDEPELVSFANEVQPIFTTSCALGGCHDQFEEAGQLNLLVDSSYAELVNVDAFLYAGEKRVIPGDTTNSILLQSIKGQVVPAMPLFNPALTAEETALIQQWVLEGALNN